MNITTKVKTDLIEAVAIHNEIAKLTAKLEAFKTEYRGKLSPEQEITLDTGEHMKKGKTHQRLTTKGGHSASPFS